MDMKTKGSKELFDEVIATGLCCYCGGCAGSCPYLVAYKGRIVLMDKCTLADGHCYQYCPRTYTDMDAISQRIFGVPYSFDELGTVREVFMARSTDPRIRDGAQYGGTVTALVSLALSEGIIDGAILARTRNDKTSDGFLAENFEAVLQSRGSNYTAAPLLQTYNRLGKDSKRNLGIVAMPCQALAISKMKADPPADRVNISNLRLSIGLFCTWALSPDRFHQFLEKKVDLAQVAGFDITPPPKGSFEVHTESGKILIPLDEIRPLVMPACGYCLDMTAEFTDISVGSVEGIPGWNTVLVRTAAGEELIKIAKSKQTIETRPLPPQNLAHLKDAALLKKKRALNAIIKKSGDKRNLLYVGLAEKVLDELLA